MIKPIMGSPIVRKFAIGAVFAGAVASGQAAQQPFLIRFNELRAKSQANKELYDANVALYAREFAEKAKMTRLASADTLTLSQTSSNLPNKELERKVLRFAENDQELVEIQENIDDLYKDHGLYGASMWLESSLLNVAEQNALDKFKEKVCASIDEKINKARESNPEKFMEMDLLESMYSALDFFGLEEHASPEESLKEPFIKDVDKFKSYLKNTWGPYRQQCILDIIKQGNGKPSAQACSDGIENMRRSIPFFTKEDHDNYEALIKSYKLSMKGCEIDQANLLAYKLYAIDYLVIGRNIDNFKIIKDNEREFKRSLSSGPFWLQAEPPSGSRVSNSGSKVSHSVFLFDE